MLDIISLKSIHFTINTISFQHDFIVFQSIRDQFLLGLDFFRMHNLSIYPNKGIAFENNQIYSAQELSLPKYAVYLNPLSPGVLDPGNYPGGVIGSAWVVIFGDAAL